MKTFNRLQEAKIIAQYALVADTMKECGGNKSKTGRVLGVDRKTIENVINKYSEYLKTDKRPINLAEYGVTTK